MPAARFPVNEGRRLRALRASGLLDGAADPRLDAIVGRAADLFEVPIAAVSLLDCSRQHFKASTGLGVPYTPRDAAFCAHAILGDEPLVVLDATDDPRFADNPLVLGLPGIRFYAGMRVLGPGRLAFGALCVVDLETRPAVPSEMLILLQQMADEVSAIIGAPQRVLG